MKEFNNLVLTITFLFSWIAGAVLAKGWVSTIFAIFFPVWAWYLVMEKLLTIIGWI